MESALGGIIEAAALFDEVIRIVFDIPFASALLSLAGLLIVGGAMFVGFWFGKRRGDK